MSTNEIGEKIYYSDASSKVTNLRVTCNHMTVPVEKIRNVCVNFKVEQFSFGALAFLSSFAPFLFFSFIPDSARPAVLALELILIAASALWLFMIYRKYIELTVNVTGRELIILRTNVRKEDYVFKVADAIGEAISDENKYHKLNKSVEAEPPSAFNSTETIRLRLMLDDYENLKSMREELIKGKTKNS